jgi:hypothetical protein
LLSRLLRAVLFCNRIYINMTKSSGSKTVRSEIMNDTEIQNLVNEVLSSKKDFGSYRMIKKELCHKFKDEFKKGKAVPLDKVIAALFVAKDLVSLRKDLVPQIDKLLKELEMTKSLKVSEVVLVDTEKDSVSYSQSPSQRSGQEKNQWDQGAWLFCISDQHPFQWAIRRNLEIEHANNKKKASNVITYEGRDLSSTVTNLERNGDIVFFTSDGNAKISFADWKAVQSKAVKEGLTVEKVAEEEDKLFKEKIVANAKRAIDIGYEGGVTPDNFMAYLKKTIIMSIGNFTSDEKVAKSEDITQRLLNDLAELERMVQSLPEKDKKQLADPITSNVYGVEVSKYPPMVGNTLSPAFVFDVFSSIVLDRDRSSATPIQTAEVEETSPKTAPISLFGRVRRLFTSATIDQEQDSPSPNIKVTGPISDFGAQIDNLIKVFKDLKIDEDRGNSEDVNKLKKNLAIRLELDPNGSLLKQLENKKMDQEFQNLIKRNRGISAILQEVSQAEGLNPLKKYQEQKYQDSTRYQGGTNDLYPVFTVLREARDSIFPKVKSGARNYQNWLGNLSYLTDVRFGYDPKSMALKPGRVQGMADRFLGFFTSMSNFGPADGSKQDVVGDSLVKLYVEGQEDSGRRKAAVSSPKFGEISVNAGIEDSVSKVLGKIIEEQKDSGSVSVSSVKAKLFAELYNEKVVRGDDVPPQEVYAACERYLAKNRSKMSQEVTDKFDLFLDELRVISCLTALDGYKVAVSRVDGGENDKSWKNGPWLRDLENKDVLQWGLEYNHQLAKDQGDGKRKAEEYIQIDFKGDKSRLDLLLYAHGIQAGFPAEGMVVPALKWAIEENISIDRTQTAKDMVMNSPVLARERLLAFEDAVKKGDDTTNDYIENAIRYPHIVDCQLAARYLIFRDKRYNEILPQNRVRELCDSIVDLGDKTKNLENLFAAVNGNAILVKEMQSQVKELLYEQSKVLQKQIDENLQDENRAELELELKKCDQLYDLFSSPSFLDKDRKIGKVNDNCRLLGSDSKLAKLFETRSLEDIATQFDRNREYKKPFTEKVWSGIKIAAGTVGGVLLGGVASSAVGVGSTVGKVAGGILGFGVTYTSDNINDFFNKVNKGDVKFDSAEESTCQLTCNAKLRRNTEKVMDIVGQKEQDRKDGSLLRRWGHYLAVATNNLLPDNKKLSNEISDASEEMKGHVSAIQMMEANSWFEISGKCFKTGKEVGRVITEKVGGIVIAAGSGIAGFADGAIGAAWKFVKDSTTSSDDVVEAEEKVVVAATIVKETSNERKPWFKFLRKKDPPVVIKDRKPCWSVENDQNTNDSIKVTKSEDDDTPSWFKTGSIKLGIVPGTSPQNPQAEAHNRGISAE